MYRRKIIAFFTDLIERFHYTKAAGDPCGKTHVYKARGGAIFCIVLLAIPLGFLISCLVLGGVDLSGVDTTAGKFFAQAFFALLLVSLLYIGYCYVRAVRNKLTLTPEKMVLDGAVLRPTGKGFGSILKFEIKYMVLYGDWEVELPWSDIKALDFEQNRLVVETGSHDVYLFDLSLLNVKAKSQLRRYWEKYGQSQSR